MQAHANGPSPSTARTYDLKTREQVELETLVHALPVAVEIHRRDMAGILDQAALRELLAQMDPRWFILYGIHDRRA